ncbi:MAG: demethoxyubiquinone hydroxylase family protein [Armatimonadota bacterium]|nr:demethoxyubiquinone hydroxylase family protein [Armatimonadota bacterium]
MPELTNPYIGLTPRKMNNEELARAIRQDIIAEHDAVALYEAHIDATDDEVAKAIIKHIADEERKHVAEFTALLERLDPDQARLGAEAYKEAEQMMAGVMPMETTQIQQPETQEQDGAPAPAGLTVGSLIGG